jgi:Putative MetA-pathway of phenol degradation
MAKRLAILTLGALLAGTDARAQSAGDALRAILFTDGLDGTPGALSENSSSALHGLLLGETTTFPIGSSAGGFAWTFDSDLRVPIRRSSSFGPMFAERPFTTGRRRLNVGAVFQRTTFKSVGGQPLTELESSVSYQSPRHEYRYTSSVQVEMARTIVSATYGIHDRVDIGVIAPMGRATVSGFSSYYQLEKGVESTSRTDSSGSSFGIGDVVIRTKTALMATHRFDAAASLDVRLPTGDPDRLMGTGYTQAKIMFIGGSTMGSLTPHLNLGYTFGGSGMEFGDDTRWDGSEGDPDLIQRQPSQEFNYTVGVDVAATPRITIAGDVIGRVVQRSAALTTYDSGGPDREIKLVVVPGTVHLLLGAVGAKVNVGGSWLATGTILFPLNDNGITPGVTPVFGFERAF